MKYKILALCGESGVGKDYILNHLCSYPDFKDKVHKIVSCTTRPPREGEVDGEDYHFLTVDDFAEKVLNMEMLEATLFNNWGYGTSISSLDKDKINIGVFNAEGINNLTEDNRIDLWPIRIWVSPKQRLINCLNREENPDCNEICRRFLADAQEQFPFPLDLYYNENKELDYEWFMDKINSFN